MTERLIFEYDENGEPVTRPATAEENADLDALAAEAEAEIARLANADTIRDRLRDGIATADQHIAALEGANPTAAQLRAATLFAVRAVKALARLELSELDETE